MAMKPRPAKDLKPTGARAKFLMEGKQRQTRKLAEEMRKKAKAQAADKKPRPAKDIKQGGAREKLLKDSRAGKIKAQPAPSSSADTIKGSIGATVRGVVKAVAKRAVPAVGFIIDAPPAQAPAPKKGEKLMKGMPSIGYGGGQTDYGRSAAMKKTTKKKDVIGNNPNRGLAQSSKKKDVIGNNPNRGLAQSSKASDFKKKNLAANQSAGKKSGASSASSAPVKREITFQEAVRRNVTEEYMKKKMRPKKSLFGSLRNKRNK